MMVDTFNTTNRKVNLKNSTPQSPKRPPLLPSEDDNNGVRRPKAREVSSRYLSSVSSTLYSSPRRSPSPMVLRTVESTPTMVKRAQSVERRISTPRPMTPGDAGEISQAAKMLLNSKRCMSVSFQCDSTKAVPVLNLSSVRKGIPGRRMALAQVRDQRENLMSRSVDFTSAIAKLGESGSVAKVLQKSIKDDTYRYTAESKSKQLRWGDSVDLGNRSANEVSDPILLDPSSILSGNASVLESAKARKHSVVVPARSWQETSSCIRRLHQPGSVGAKNSGLRTIGMAPTTLYGTKKLLIDCPASSPRGVSASRGQPSPRRGAVRPTTPSRNVASSISSPVRGTSPSRARNGVGSTPLAGHSSSTSSILSFVANARRGKVGENGIVDAHHLTVIYNQHLQWRFANARADAAMLVNKGITEKSLYNAWLTTARLRHAVIIKRIELQVLRQNLKTHFILDGQMLYLENWDIFEKDYSCSLSGAIKALEGSTLRLPIVGGARADIHSLEGAICSSVDVMQAMTSSITKLLITVDHVNSLASELASVTSDEHASLDRCRDLLSKLTAMQVEECSLQSHMLQLKDVS